MRFCLSRFYFLSLETDPNLQQAGELKTKRAVFELKTKAGYEMDAEIKGKAAKKVTRIEY